MSRTGVFLAGVVVGLVLGVGGVLLVLLLGSAGSPLPVSPLDGGSRVQIIAEESHVNSVLAVELAKDPRFGDPVMDLRSPNLALVTVGTKVAGVVLRPTVTIGFGVEDNRIDVAVLELVIAGLRIPRGLVGEQLANLEEEIEEQANLLVAGTLGGTGLQVVSVSATETSLVIGLGE